MLLQSVISRVCVGHSLPGVERPELFAQGVVGAGALGRELEVEAFGGCGRGTRGEEEGHVWCRDVHATRTGMRTVWLHNSLFACIP